MKTRTVGTERSLRGFLASWLTAALTIALVPGLALAQAGDAPEEAPVALLDADAAGAGWRDTLQRYEAALEAKNMTALQSVWELNQGDPYRRRWERKFSRSDTIEIDIRIRKVNEKGDRVEVLFDQTEIQGSRDARTYSYQVVLLRRATTDDWQIRGAHVGL